MEFRPSVYFHLPTLGEEIVWNSFMNGEEATELDSKSPVHPDSQEGQSLPAHVAFMTAAKAMAT